MLKILYASCLNPSPAVSAVKLCVAAPNSETFTIAPYFERSISFKVIDIVSHKKLVTSACYGKHNVCAYMQPFLR